MNRMRKLREEKGISMREAASCLKMPYTTYVNYEKGTREPNSETLIAIAAFYGTSIDYLIGNPHIAVEPFAPANLIPMPEMQKIPLVGAIACGSPILAEQNIEDYIDLPRHIHADYALTCKGNSMINAGIRDGDVVYIRKQEQVDNGQIAAVLVGDEEATLKRFYYDGKMIQLVAENPAYPPKVFYGSEMQDIHVIGLAIAYTHAIQ